MGKKVYFEKSHYGNQSSLCVLQFENDLSKNDKNILTSKDCRIIIETETENKIRNQKDIWTGGSNHGRKKQKDKTTSIGSGSSGFYCGISWSVSPYV